MAPQASKKCGLLPPDHHTHRLLHEHRPRFGTGFWRLLRAHDLSAPSISINTKREKVPDTVFMSDTVFMFTRDGCWVDFNAAADGDATTSVHQASVSVPTRAGRPSYPATPLPW